MSSELKDKKSLQLGMNASTANGRLVKDILYSLIVKTGQNKCCKCKMPMSRDTFSIEHLVPWLDSEEPLKLFFDLENIYFSHLKCNCESARKPQKKYFTEDERKAGSALSQRNCWNLLSKEEQQERRRLKYLKYKK